jgi:tetratricopeptide (TPR) repeat protein
MFFLPPVSHPAELDAAGTRRVGSMAVDALPKATLRGAGRPQTVHLRLDRLVQSDPQQAITEATSLLQQRPHDPVSAMGAWATIGRALYELGDMQRAPQAIRRALASGALAAAATDASGPEVDCPGGSGAMVDPGQLTSVRLSAAAIFVEAGDLREALVQLDEAQAAGDAGLLGRVLTQRAFVLYHAGRLSEALVQADLADAQLRRSGDPLGRLRMLVNRSLIQLQRGDLVAAETDLTAAQRLAEQLDQNVTAAMITANLGVLHGRAGRIAMAVDHFDRARQAYVAAGNPLRAMAILEADRAETLLQAGLFADAVAAAEMAVSHAGAPGNEVGRGDAQLLLARTQLAAGHLAAARRTAASACRGLTAAGRNGVAVQARSVELQAALGFVVDVAEATVLLARARRLCTRLTLFGWVDRASALRLARVRCASRLDILGEVAADLAVLRSAMRSKHPATAVLARYANAMMRAHAGDELGALRSVRSGMRVLDRHRSTTADLQLRAALSALGEDLSAVGVRLAVADGRPSLVLDWAESTRAGALRPTPSQPTGPAFDSGRVTVTSLRTLLGRRTLVEYVIDRERVWAVVIAPDRARLVSIGPLAEIVRMSAQLAAWMDRACQPDPPPSADAARRVAARLDQLLVQPLQIHPMHPVVVVPVGALHSVPWSALPSLASRSLSTSASARMWAASEARAATRPCQTVALLLGPDVAGAEIERSAVRRRHPTALIVRGTRATAARARALLSGFDVVQLAAHGQFRGDHPLLSSLRLHGGDEPLVNLAGSAVSALLVVLSSCDGGSHGVTAGEVLGPASVLLSSGAAAVVAPVATVPDLACAEFVAELHLEWQPGTPVATALALVRHRWLYRAGLAHWATASAFACFGSGAVTSCV